MMKNILETTLLNGINATEKVRNMETMFEKLTSNEVEELGMQDFRKDNWGLPWWLRQQSICLQCGRPRFNPWVGKTPWRRTRQHIPVLLPGKSHGQRSLVGYSPWDRKESDTTEQLHFHFQYTHNVSF